MKPAEKLIVANWKMHGDLEMAYAYVWELLELRNEGGGKNTLVICPPTPYLSFVAGRLAASGVGLGAQDCSAHEKGAFTGEVSAPMLADVGCRYVIIGHSECRHYHQESSEALANKIHQALAAHLIPIFCVGEMEQDREQGITQQVLEQQLSILASFRGHSLVIAYEPVWAIGTGRIPQNQDIEEACALIRKVATFYEIKPTILYGGSVKAENAQEILSLPEVEGALVGGASLKPLEFWKIASAV